MGKIFDLDNPLMKGLSRMADMMALNLLVVVCSLPIFTAGSAITAMYYVELKWAKEEEGYVIKPFFREFRSNFKQATVEWLIMLGVAVVIALDISLFYMNPTMFPNILKYLVIGIAVVLYLIFQWVFLLQCHFVNTVKATFKNAAILAVANLPRTIGMGLCQIAGILCLILGAVVWTAIFPIVFLFFISVPGYLCCKLVKKPFSRFEPEEKEVLSEEEDEAEKEEAYRILREESAIRPQAPYQEEEETQENNMQEELEGEEKKYLDDSWKEPAGAGESEREDTQNS